MARLNHLEKKAKMIDKYSPSEWENLYLQMYADSALSDLSQSAKAGRNGLTSDGKVEKMILEDIWKKISQKSHQEILDLGCGCGPLTNQIMERCNLYAHSLTMMDQELVISKIANSDQTLGHVKLIHGIFPYDSNLLGNQRFDSIILYGVIHYTTDPVNFIYSLIEFLKPGGHLLIADIPNSDKKQRFMLTKHGIQIDKEYRNSFNANNNVMPIAESQSPIEFNDVFVTNLLRLTRNKGCESFLLSQPPGLPFCFTRDDILVVKNLA